jgi:outer membrane lipoprotein-sorting protein
MKKILFLFLLGFIVFSCINTSADTVVLKNGACYEGKVLSDCEDELIIQLDIGDLTIDKNDIKTVEISQAPPQPKQVSLSEAEKVIKNLKAQAAVITSYRCKMRSELYDGSTINSKIICKVPDLLRAEYVVTSNVSSIGRMEVEAVKNRDVFWLYYPQMNMVYKQETDAKDSVAPGMDELVPAALLEQLSDAGVRFLGYESVDNYEAACFEVDMQEQIEDLSGMGQKKTVVLSKMYFRTKDGFLIKNTGYDKDGTILFINSTRDIETNINIDENDFYFAPPEGAQVIDASALKGLEDMF